MPKQVVNQFKFLIMLSLHDDEDYRKTGITVHNMKAFLGENKVKWFKVGLVSDQKQFETRISGMLSQLEREDHALRKHNNRYYMGYDFNNVFEETIERLVSELELDIEFGTELYEGSVDKAKVINGLKDGTYKYSILTSIQETDLNMMTEEQITRLSQLSVETGIAL